MGFAYAYIRNWDSILFITLFSFSTALLWLSIKDAKLFNETNRRLTYFVFFLTLFVFLYSLLQLYYLTSYSDSVEKKLVYNQVESQKLNDDITDLESTPDYLAKQTLDNEGRVISQSNKDNKATNTFKSDYTDKAQTYMNYPKKRKYKDEAKIKEVKKILEDNFFFSIKRDVPV